MNPDPIPSKRSPVWNDIQAVVTSLRAEDCDYIRELPEENLVLLHHTLGRVIRNAFRSGKYDSLFSYCDQQQTAESRSFDSISSEAIKLIWKYLSNSNKVQE